MNGPVGFHLQAADGRELRARDWRPPGEARATLLLLHGMGEHLGRYEQVAGWLSMEGIRVLGLDFRGHGMSTGRRTHVRSFAEYHRDLEALAALVEGRFSILAHSTGGLVALSWPGLAAGRVDKLVLTSPLLGEAVAAPAWKRALAPLMAVVAPAVPLDAGLPLHDLISDADAVAVWRDDPLRVPTVTPGWYAAMRRAVRGLETSLPQQSTPLQLHRAGRERIVDAQALQELPARYGGPVEAHDWPLGCHELLMEPFAGELLETAKEFLLRP